MTEAALTAPKRPSAVTVAFAFLIAIAGLLLLMAGLAVADAIRYSGVIDEAARLAGPGTLAEDIAYERSDNVTGSLFAAIPALVLAIWLGIMAIGIRRGSNVARILALVGLASPIALGAVFCGFGGLVGMVAFSMMGEPEVSDVPDEDPDFDGGGDFSFDPGTDFYSQLDRLDGGAWSVTMDAISATAGIAVLLLGVSAFVLLLIGPANRHFRPPGTLARPRPLPYLYPPSPYWGAPPGPVPGPPAGPWQGTLPGPLPAPPAGPWQGPPPEPPEGPPGPPTLP